MREGEGRVRGVFSSRIAVEWGEMIAVGSVTAEVVVMPGMKRKEL